MKVPEDMGMSMADGVNGGVRRGLSRQSRSQSRLVNLIDALVGIDSTKEDPFMLLTIRQGFFCASISRGLEVIVICEQSCIKLKKSSDDLTPH